MKYNTNNLDNEKDKVHLRTGDEGPEVDYR